MDHTVAGVGANVVYTVIDILLFFGCCRVSVLTLPSISLLYQKC